MWQCTLCDSVFHAPIAPVAARKLASCGECLQRRYGDLSQDLCGPCALQQRGWLASRKQGTASAISSVAQVLVTRTFYALLTLQALQVAYQIVP